MTALMIAFHKGYVNVINALANAGAKLDVQEEVSCLMFCYVVGFDNESTACGDD